MELKLKLTLQNLLVNATAEESYTINSTDDTLNKTETSRIRSFYLTQPLQTDKRYLIVYDVLSITDGDTIGTYFKNSEGSFQYSVANMKTTGRQIITITPKVEASVFAIYFDKSTDVEKIATFKNPAIFEYHEGMEKWIDEVNSFVIPNSNILDKIDFITDLGTEDFTVGKLIVPTAKIKLHESINIKIGDIITIYLDDAKYGTYEPYEIKQGQMSRDVTLYAVPYFALTKTFQPQSTSYTTRSLLLEMQTTIGFSVVNFQNIVAVDMNDVKADTGVNLLQTVAMLLGLNVTINQHGEIQFIDVLTSPEYNLTQSQITSCTKADTADYHITRIIGKLNDSDENPIIVGTQANSWNDLTLINPYLTEGICTGILSKLPKYTGFDLTVFDAPILRPLNKIKFSYKDVEYTIPVMNLTLTFSVGGLVAKVQASVSNAQDKSSDYKGSLTTRLEVIRNVTSELNTKVQVVDGNVSSLITRTDAIQGDIDVVVDQYSQINQTVGEIDLRVGQVQTELGDKVSTDEIITSINLSNEGVKIEGDKIQLTGGTIVVNADGSSMSLDEYLKAEDDSENFVLSPNFNSGSLSPNWTWSVGSFVYVDTTYKHDESTACRLKGSAGAISLNTKNISIGKLEKGKTYKLSMWVYCESTSSVTGEFQLCMYGKSSDSTSNTLIDSLSFNGDNLTANQWTRLSFEFTPTQEYSTPSITVKGISGSIDAWVTDFELVQKGESFTQEQLINIINGAGDGFYILDGQAYINAEYIQTGTMRADLIKVQVDGTSNLIPFNYVTMDNAINTTNFSIMSANDIPYLSCELPIFQGGASSDVMCTQIGYSDVEIESGKDYWFMCEYFAVWGSDTKPEDNVGTSTATSGSKNGGLQNGQNMTLFLYDGDNASNAKNDGYFQLATVYDFNASVKIEEREGYTGVYQRTWTTLTARITATESYKGKLCINLDCSGFIYTGDGGSLYLRRFQLTDATQTNPTFIDYTKQIKEKHMELTDGSYYKNIVGVDGVHITNGYITGDYPLSSRAFTIDDNGFRCRATTGSENAFVGVNQSYYSYDGGSSGQITGYDDIYGFGCREIVSGTSEGIFVGVHHGFQKPNSTDYGRADIYTLYKDGYAYDTQDWTLLGAKVEPNALVRRNDNCSIATNGLVIQGDATNDDFSQGGTTYHGSVIFSEPLYSKTSNGQIINIHKDNKRIYFGNPNSDVQIEGSGISIRYGTSDPSPVICKANLHDSIYINAQDSTETGREIKDWGVHSYNLYSRSLTNGDGTSSAYGGYWSVLTFGNGTSGSAQLAIDWTSQGKGFYMRSLRDTGDNWYKWKRIGNSDWLLDSTSDERYKRAISDVSTEDCYNMVKNIELHSYLLLTEEERHLAEKGELDADELFLRTVTSEGIHHNLQMGVLAQDILKYSCGSYVVNQDVLRDENGELISDRYGIDAYNYASAILGGLQEEIKIRDKQYEELQAKNQELEERLARLEALLLQD